MDVSSREIVSRGKTSAVRMRLAHEMIPSAWVKHYVDALLSVAGKLEPGPMRDAVLLRADHAMELVKAYRELAADWRHGQDPH